MTDTLATDLGPYSDKYECPCCKHKLRVLRRDCASVSGTPATEHFILYCSNGLCKSKTSNDGGEGATELAAFVMLCDKYDKEEPSND